MALRQRVLFNPLVYPLWGPLALQLNIALYGHRYTGDGWTARLWKRTRWGQRGLAARETRYAQRRYGSKETS